MKKTYLTLISLALLLSFCLALTSCGSNTKNPIDFGKKYMLSEDTYYIFYSNNTGVFEHRYVDTAYNYTISGKVEFVWREASDGAVHLFDVKTEYDDDHTEGRSISITNTPIYFSEEFFTYERFSDYVTNGHTNEYYVKEGSKLETILDKK